MQRSLTQRRKEDKLITKELFAIKPEDHKMPGLLTQEEILRWFRLADAHWVHEGDPSSSKPHAELTSGLCSNGYFDVPRLLSYPWVAQILGQELAFRMGITPGTVDWVVSSAYSAITFGHEVAKALGARFANVEKDPEDPAQKRMLWRRLTLPAGARVLQVEELITTMGTTTEVRRAVEEGNEEKILNFLPVVGTLVHRPPDLREALLENNVVALVEQEVWAKRPEGCPLCAVGSPRFKPKTHWIQLTRKG